MENKTGIFLAQMGAAFRLGQMSPSTLKTVPRSTSEVLQGIKELAGEEVTRAKCGLADESPLTGKPSGTGWSCGRSANGEFAAAVRQTVTLM